jgi:3-phenylpropionate/trans-cinnamate dioxygenase ferredoxin subunit
MSGDWQDVGAADELTEDTPLPVTLAGRSIGVYQLGDQYYALEDVCPHADALLTQGFVMGDEIECPLHGARFHIPTGKCTREPGERDLACFPVKREGARILLRID